MAAGTGTFRSESVSDGGGGGGAEVSAPGRWQTAAACRGRTDLMYDAARHGEARALCVRCPVVEVCLAASLWGEREALYRFGVAGGQGPSQREALSRTLSSAELAQRLTAALAAWRAGTARPAEPEWTPPSPSYRRRRRCRGCDAVIRQPRAGRPRVWCSSACRQRATGDRAAGAAAARRRWAELDEAEKERRRAAMRARWASLSEEERAKLAARRRARRRARAA